MKNQREIKFRAWDRTNKVMHLNVSCHSGTLWIFVDHLLRAFGLENSENAYDKLITKGYMPGVEDMWYCKHDVVYIQDTGLTDEDGNEIHEGDIVNDDIREEVGEVYYSEGAFHVDAGHIIELLSELNNSVGVVGNIYENPELLSTES